MMFSCKGKELRSQFNPTIYHSKHYNGQDYKTFLHW